MRYRKKPRNSQWVTFYLHPDGREVKTRAGLVGYTIRGSREQKLASMIPEELRSTLVLWYQNKTAVSPEQIVRKFEREFPDLRPPAKKEVEALLSIAARPKKPVEETPARVIQEGMLDRALVKLRRDVARMANEHWIPEDVIWQLAFDLLPVQRIIDKARNLKLPKEDKDEDFFNFNNDI